MRRLQSTEAVLWVAWNKTKQFIYRNAFFKTIYKLNRGEEKIYINVKKKFFIFYLITCVCMKDIRVDVVIVSSHISGSLYSHDTLYTSTYRTFH